MKSVFENYEIQLEEAEGITDYENVKKQNIVFPFVEGQKLMEGDYLADDGIHHKRKQKVLDGTENWTYDSMGGNTGTAICFRTEIEDYIGNESSFATTGKIICSHFKEQGIYQNDLEGVRGGWGKNIFLKLEQSNLTTADVAGFKSWLAARKEAGTPVVVEYELAEEEVESYTEAQKEAWKQIENLRSYEGQTNIFSTDEISSSFEVTAKSNLSETLSSLDEKIGDIDTALDSISGEVV